MMLTRPFIILDPSQTHFSLAEVTFLRLNLWIQGHNRFVERKCGSAFTQDSGQEAPSITDGFNHSLLKCSALGWVPFSPACPLIGFCRRAAYVFVNHLESQFLWVEFRPSWPWLRILTWDTGLLVTNNVFLFPLPAWLDYGNSRQCIYVCDQDPARLTYTAERNNIQMVGHTSHLKIRCLGFTALFKSIFTVAPSYGISKLKKFTHGHANRHWLIKVASLCKYINKFGHWNVNCTANTLLLCSVGCCHFSNVDVYKRKKHPCFEVEDSSFFPFYTQPLLLPLKGWGVLSNLRLMVTFHGILRFRVF